MANVPKLLDKIKERHHLGTDWQLKKHLGVSIQRLRGWRKGNIPDNNAARLISEALGMPLDQVISYIDKPRTRKSTAAR